MRKTRLPECPIKKVPMEVHFGCLLGPSIALAIRGNWLHLCTWRQVAAVNHHNRARRRIVEAPPLGG